MLVFICISLYRIMDLNSTCLETKGALSLESDDIIFVRNHLAASSALRQHPRPPTPLSLLLVFVVDIGDFSALCGCASRRANSREIAIYNRRHCGHPILLRPVLVLAHHQSHCFSVLTCTSRLSYNSLLEVFFFFSNRSYSQPPPSKSETMMGFLSSAVGASKRPRGASVGEEIPEDTEPDDTSILCVSRLSSLRSPTIHLSPCPFPPPSITSPSSSLYPTSIMLAVDTRTEIPHIDFRDENEGSIISSLISQLRSVLSHHASWFHTLEAPTIGFIVE